MEKKPKIIKSYTTTEGKSPFDDWLRKLKDKKAIARILQRIDRVSLGNFGDCRSVGKSVYELRIHFGPGYRIYFGIANEQLIILLSAGFRVYFGVANTSLIILLSARDKSFQRKDISTTQTYWEEYQKNAN